jgi:hypothetical protein
MNQPGPKAAEFYVCKTNVITVLFLMENAIEKLGKENGFAVDVTEDSLAFRR